MNKVDKIKYIMKLEKEKAKLERKLAFVNKCINVRKNTCSHVSVDLGYCEIYPNTSDEYSCLLCGMGKNPEYYYEPKYVVHAENYLPQYDIKDNAQCLEKFEHIQMLALGILKDKPDMSNEELVSRLNTLIEDSIIMPQDTDKINEPKLIKKPTSKK